MQEISRVSVYFNALDFIENIEFRNDGFRIESFLPGREIIDNLLRFNIYILDGIENYFLIDNGEFDFSIGVPELTKKYLDKINDIDINSYNKILTERDIEKMKSIVNNDKKENEEGRDVYYIFSAILNVLNKLNNKIFSINRNILYPYIKKICRYRYNYKNQVFLSHAFDDKLYTTSLFIFMSENDIFLYVDWMFSPEFDNGFEIKKNLYKELSNSNQLLFMRTVSSELSIRGGGNIRGWCSWELGIYYSMGRCRCLRGCMCKCGAIYDKFYIEIYRGRIPQINNKQLDGLKPLKSIQFGWLE